VQLQQSLVPEGVANEEFPQDISAHHAGMTPLALACALNKLPSVKVEHQLQTPFFVASISVFFFKIIHTVG